MVFYSIPFVEKVSLKHLKDTGDFSKQKLLTITIKTNKSFSHLRMSGAIILEIGKRFPDFSPNSVLINVIRSDEDRISIEMTNFSEIVDTL